MTDHSNLVHSIVVATATYTGDIIAVARTRISGDAIVCDHVEATDIDAFCHAPAPNGQPGITISIQSQESKDHNIPSYLWTQYFDLLSAKLHLDALNRKTSVVTHTNTIQSDIPAPPPNFKGKGLVVAVPTDLKTHLVYLDNEPFESYLLSSDLPRHLVNQFIESHKVKTHPNYDPHYKDSPYPDDYDTCPF